MPTGRSAAAASVLAVALLLAACGGAGRAALPFAAPGGAVGGHVHYSKGLLGLPVASTTTSTTPTTRPVTASTAPAGPSSAPGWTAGGVVPPPDGGISGVSCLSEVFCVAVGGGLPVDPGAPSGPEVALSWDGVAWSPPSVVAPTTGVPSTSPVLPSIACTAGPRCTVADGSDHVSTGDGTDWTAPVAVPTGSTLPANPADPGPGVLGSRSVAVACGDPSSCAVVANDGSVADVGPSGPAASTPFGTVWPPGSSSEVALYQDGRPGITCADATCVAVVGTTVLVGSGGSWSDPGRPVGPAATWSTPGPTAVDCPDPSWCVVVHGSSVSQGSPARGWSPPVVVDTGGDLDAVSCPAVGRCVASDQRGDVVTLARGAWSGVDRVLPSAVEYPGDGTSLSCPSTSFCLLVDGDGEYATYRAPGSPVP